MITTSGTSTRSPCQATERDTISGVISAPMPKHRWSAFSDEPTRSGGWLQTNKVLHPTSTIAAPMPISAKATTICHISRTTVSDEAANTTSTPAASSSRCP